MTRKDFELIAKVVRSVAVYEWYRDTLAINMADALAPTNPNFKRGIFLKACGVSLGRETEEEEA